MSVVSGLAIKTSVGRDQQRSIHSFSDVPGIDSVQLLHGSDLVTCQSGNAAIGRNPDSSAGILERESNIVTGQTVSFGKHLDVGSFGSDQTARRPDPKRAFFVLDYAASVFGRYLIRPHQTNSVKNVYAASRRNPDAILSSLSPDCSYIIAG